MPRHDTHIRRPRLTLAGAVCGYVALTALAVIAGGFLIFFPRADRLLDAALDSAVRLRTQAAAQNFARVLHDDWSDLTAVAGRIAALSQDEMRGVLDGLQGDGRRISWIGYADIRGEVRVASDGLLEGADVSAQPWFRNGLRGSFAGGLHEPALLAEVLPRREDAGSMRVIDLAHPVRDAEGDVIGAVGVHIDFAWADAMLREQAEVLGVDLYLLAADGAVILASNGENPSPEELSILRAARFGSAAGRETWPDGQEYFASLVPSVGYGGLPSFGWRLVGRLNADAFRPGLESLQGSAVTAALGLVVILVAATSLFVAVYVRPLVRLGDAAERIAEGEDVYPPEADGTRESAQISAALARLQSRRPEGDAAGSSRGKLAG